MGHACPLCVLSHVDHAYAVQAGSLKRRQGQSKRQSGRSLGAAAASQLPRASVDPTTLITCPKATPCCVSIRTCGVATAAALSSVALAAAQHVCCSGLRQVWAERRGTAPARAQHACRPQKPALATVDLAHSSTSPLRSSIVPDVAIGQSARSEHQRLAEFAPPNLIPGYQPTAAVLATQCAPRPPCKASQKQAVLACCWPKVQHVRTEGGPHLSIPSL